MSESQRPRFLRGFGVTSLGTLASRVLGMWRDVATAAVLGLSGDGVADAFVLAFRIPHLARRLFAEGALSASYVPELSREFARSPTAGWRLANASFAGLAVALGLLVLAGEAVCLAGAANDRLAADIHLLAGLSAVMLPYLWLVCLAAQATGTLWALGRFTIPALAPLALNICWLAGAAVAAYGFAGDKATQAYVLAVSISLAGVVQLAMHGPPLWACGWQAVWNWQASWPPLRRVLLLLAPAVVGLAAPHLNTFVDSLVAWSFAAPVAPTPGEFAWPLEPGAAAAVYYAERMYQFPLGVLGLAVATVVFPALARHAARGQRHRLSRDLTRALQLVFYWGLPASVGLAIVARPLTVVLFEHGAFAPRDVDRLAGMIVCYAIGVWAACAVPVLVRALYALGDMRSPLWAAGVSIVVNLALDLLLIWPLAERGLALVTSLVAFVQVGWLMRGYARQAPPLLWRRLASSAAWSLGLCAAMAGTSLATSMAFGADAGFRVELARLAATVVVAALVFLGGSWLARREELLLLLGRSPR